MFILLDDALNTWFPTCICDAGKVLLLLLLQLGSSDPVQLGNVSGRNVKLSGSAGFLIC